MSDFDGGSLAAAFGAGWEETTDAMMGGESTTRLEVVPTGAGGTSHALHITGKIAPGLPFAWGGAIFFPGERPMSPMDLSAADGIQFEAHGDGGSYHVLLFTRGGGPVPAVVSFTAGPEWRAHVFRWPQFTGAEFRAMTRRAASQPGCTGSR